MRQAMKIITHAQDGTCLDELDITVYTSQTEETRIHLEDQLANELDIHSHSWPEIKKAVFVLLNQLPRNETDIEWLHTQMRNLKSRINNYHEMYMSVWDENIALKKQIEELKKSSQKD